jgi:hypothetical protein
VISVNINTFEIASLQARLATFGSNVRARAMGRGLAKVAKQGATVAKTNIAKEYNVKAAAVADRLSVKSSSNGLTATISAKAKRVGSSGKSRIPLIDFGATGGKRNGVKFKILRGGSATRMRHAFIATMPSGHRGVYQRVPGSRKIVEVMGIDVPVMFAGKRVKPLVLKRINEVSVKVVSHELQYELSRLGFK